MSAPAALRIEQGARTGQPVIISLDSAGPGPALGGCRVKPYPSWRDGLDDALRLSAAMTAKTALAGLPYGGGKAVVALSPATAAHYAGARRGDLLADIGEAVESLGGRYITGPDVGTSPPDMTVIGRHTRHVLCRPLGAGGSGDSSAPTATGVLACINVLRARVFGNRPARELTFAIQGLGHVGRLIADDLARQGASLVVADTDPGRQQLASRWGARLVRPEQLLITEADILVPAALGGILTPQAVPALRCRAIAGPANNQLADDTVAVLLHAHGITWAPDPVVSAGGIIAATAREIDHLAEPEVQSLLAAIGDRLGAILDESARSALPPLTVARQRMRERLAQAPAQPGKSQANQLRRQHHGSTAQDDGLRLAPHRARIGCDADQNVTLAVQGRPGTEGRSIALPVHHRRRSAIAGGIAVGSRVRMHGQFCGTGPPCRGTR